MKVEKKVTLSIIVPIYGVEKYLNQCIDSILGQSFKDFEVILVDDGSKDNSGEICDQYEVVDERVKVIHKENGGLVSARKAGIQYAQGEYVGYVDGDDCIANNMYEQMLDKAKTYDADLVICDIMMWSENNLEKCSQVFDGGFYDKKRIQKEIIPRYIGFGEDFQNGFLPTVWNKIYKRELILQHQLNVDERLVMGEDAAVFYPLMLDVDKLYYCKGQYLYKYRYVGNSMSRTYKENHLNNIVSLCRYLYEVMKVHFENEYIERQYIRYVEYMLGNGIIQTYRYLFEDLNKEELLSMYNSIKREEWWGCYHNEMKKYEKKIKTKLAYKLLESGKMRYAYYLMMGEKIKKCIRKK